MARKVADNTGLRERNKQEKLERIRKAARTLFRQKGFDNTTIAEIAESAGVAKGTVFLYARDKHDLLFLIFLEDITAVAEKGFATLPDAPLLEQLLHVFTQLLQLYAKQPALALLFIREVLVLKEDRRDDYNLMTVEFFARVASLLDEGVRRGELKRDLDTMLTAQSLFALYAFTLLAWLQDKRPDVEMGREMLRRSFALLWDGLSA